MAESASAYVPRDEIDALIDGVEASHDVESGWAGEDQGEDEGAQRGEDAQRGASNGTAAPAVAPEPEPVPQARPRTPQRREPVQRPEDMSLREWLLHYELRPGVRWYNLSRLAPAEVMDSQGVTRAVLGLIEERQHRPISEGYLRDKWGGNVWEIVIYERNVKSGRERRVAAREVSIGSEPIAYLSGSKRVALDPDQDDWGQRPPADHDDDWAGSPRWVGGGQGSRGWSGNGGGNGNGYGNGNGNGWGGQQDPNYGPRPYIPRQVSVTAPLEELAKARSAESIDLVKTISDTLSKGQGRIDDLMKTQLDRLSSELTKAHEDGNKPATQYLEMLSAQISNLAERYQYLMSSLQENAKAQLEALRLSTSAESERTRVAYQTEVERRDQMHRADLQRQVDQFTLILSAKDRDVDRARSDAERLLVDLKERQKDTLDRIQHQNDTVLAAKSAEIDRMKSDHDRSLTDLKERYDLQISNLRSDVQSRVTDTERHGGVLLEIVRQEKTRLEKEVESLRAETLALREKSAPDMQTQIEHLAGVAENLQTLGMIGGGGDKTEGPKAMIASRVGHLLESLADSLGPAMALKLRGAQPAQQQQPVYAAPPGYALVPAGAIQGQPQQVMQQPRQPMQAGPIQTAPTQEAAAEAPGAPDARLNGVDGTQVAAFVASLEEQREQGVPAAALAEAIAEQYPRDALAAVLVIDLSAIIDAATAAGVDTAGTPAGRQYLFELYQNLRTRLQIA